MIPVLPKVLAWCPSRSQLPTVTTLALNGLACLASAALGEAIGSLVDRGFQSVMQEIRTVSSRSQTTTVDQQLTTVEEQLTRTPAIACITP